MQLNEIVPWGRNGDEYQQMFNLSDFPVGSRILGCGDGPSAFNAEGTKFGHMVTSFDPIYHFDRKALKERIDEVRLEIMQQVRQQQDNYVWTSISNPEELEEIRVKAMSVFLDDFEIGKQQGRYVAGSAPCFPFKENSFDLALSSHFLFLYTDQFSYQEHLSSINALGRIANETRIYPLIAIHNNKESEYVPVVISEMRELGYAVERVPVPYEFMKGAKRMLKIKRQ